MREMQRELIARAMADMGWNPESELPMANEANRKIIEELEAMLEAKAQLTELEQQTEERASKLQQHSKNGEISINHNLKLLNAYQTELRTESHLRKLAEREHSKFREDNKTLNKDVGNLQKYVDTTENELCKRHQSVDQMTNRIQGAKTALIEWRAAMDDSHKGYELIAKYFKEDEVKARQQDQRRQKLQNAIEQGRTELVRLTDEQRSLEQNLECAANLYRSSHVERRQMVDTWKSAVQQMVQRERTIHQQELELIDVRQLAIKRTADQRRYDDRLNAIIANNHNVEAAIEELNSETSDLKDQIQRLMDMILLKENEVELLQKELQTLSQRVQQQRSENRAHDKERQAKVAELNNFTQLLADLADRLTAMQNKNMSGQQRLQLLEDMNDNEQRSQKQLNHETARINGLIFRAQQQAVEFKADQRVLEVNNGGLRVTAQTVLKSMQGMEKQLNRQTELHYNMAFKCLQMERRINKLQGGVLDPEQEARHVEYLGKLEALQADAAKRLQITEVQNKKLDASVNKVTASYNDDNHELELMQFKIKEAQTYCDGGLKRLRLEKQTNQVYIVDLSLLKMRANEFETEIARCETSTYNLAKHRMQLNRTIKDRQLEIKCQLELLYIKRKHLQEERGTLRADCGERNKHIETLRARFELTAQLLGRNEDGSIVTATQLKVETAQEKQLLLDEGDALNQRVLIAEREIKALENTLLLLGNSNDAFRRNFQQQLEGAEAEAELEAMQGNYCSALGRLKALRHKIGCMEREAEKSAAVKLDLENQLEVLSRKRLENEETLKRLQKELLEQKVKIQRAEREAKLALKTVKQSGMSADCLALYERDLAVRELNYRNTKALNQLADMVAEQDDEERQDMGAKVLRCMHERGLQLPHLLPKTHSVMSWRSEMLSEMSLASSKDVLNSTSRSSASDGSLVRTGGASSRPSAAANLSARVSVVSIDFTVNK